MHIRIEIYLAHRAVNERARLGMLRNRLKASMPCDRVLGSHSARRLDPSVRERRAGYVRDGCERLAAVGAAQYINVILRINVGR